jgi:CHASE3 domain sensor protein
VIDAASAREALLAEAIGDVAKLLDRAEALVPALDERCEALALASAALRDELADFERRITGATALAKTEAAKYIAARADEAARRSIDAQGKAMADAASVAFGVELGATMQRLRSTLQPPIETRRMRWERWLTHAAAAATGSAATWVLMLHLVPR